MAAFDFANKKGFKAFMARLYGWGASLVILGALFKINHYSGATIMLLLGMTTEAIIFFFSAFEKPHVEVDWSIVYPELAVQYGDSAVSGTPKSGRHEPPHQPIDDLNQLFKQAGVNVNLIQEFGEGLKKFSANAQQMVDVSAAAVANEGFVGNIKKASANLEALSTAYETQIKTVADMKPINSQKLQSAMDDLSNQLSMATTASSEGFVGNIKKASSNLEALSTAYEAQLKTLTPVDSQKLQMAINELSNKLQASVEGFSQQVHSGAEQINNYQKQMQTLTTNISALNNVYGNMLSALTNIKS